MVAVINTSTSIHRTLNYNEQKVKEGKAVCIHAANYPKDREQLSFYDKLNRLVNQAALNENVTRKSVHFSLNFDPKEKLPDETLKAIAETYMNKIGFGNQPYLVYRHTDAGHPHIHIVSIKVKEDGKRIDMQNMGRNQSTIARQAIEKEFGLVKADDRKLKQVYTIQPIEVQKLQYGKSDTKRAITNVLDKAVKEYKYTSLAELNAVLRQYNLVADKGKEGSRVHKNNGLQYKVLDEKGKSIGIPIKASSIYSKPTLKNLEKHFTENEQRRQPDKQKLKTAINWVLHKGPKTMVAFTEGLKKEKVHVVIRENDKGQIYGLTYIDYRTKSVFNGSDLGKAYSAAGIKDRLGAEREEIWYKQEAKELHLPGDRNNITQTQKHIKALENSTKTSNDDDTSLIEQLMQAEKLNNRAAFELLKKKRKRKPN
jgi:Relaxase/Mobilisation nuclease domain